MPNDKYDAEDLLQYGYHGTPKIRGDESEFYLSNFRERVYLFLTNHQVKRKGIYPEVSSFLQNKRVRLYLNGELDYDYFLKYIELADKQKVPYKFVNDLKTTTPIGLVIAAEKAIDQEPVYFADQYYDRDMNEDEG